MTQKEKAEYIVQKFRENIHPAIEIAPKCVEGLAAILERAQNGETRLDTSIDPETWNRLNRLLKIMRTTSSLDNLGL